MSEPIDWKALTPEQRNRLIATKVMDWTEQPCDLDAHPEMELAIYSDGFACCPRCGVYDHIGSLEHDIIPPPPYSTSMDAAWLIVEKRKGAVLDATYKHDRLLCRATFCTVEAVHEAYGVTMQEAVCIAALHAVGVEVKV
jgi:Phage ABA sandwich domain